MANAFVSRGGPPSIAGMSSLKVDNLSRRTTTSDLLPIFERYGRVGDIYIPRNRFTHESRGFAFVRFYSRRDAEDALERADGKLVDGRRLRVQNARYDRPADSGWRKSHDSRHDSYSRSRSDRSNRDRHRYRSRSYDRHRSRSQSTSNDWRQERSSSRERSPRHRRYSRQSRSPSSSISPKRSHSRRRNSSSRSLSWSSERSRSPARHESQSRSRSPSPRYRDESPTDRRSWSRSVSS